MVEDLPDWVRQNADLYNSCVAGAISEPEYIQGLEKAGLEQVEVKDRLVYDKEQIVFEGDRRVLLKRRSHWLRTD